MGGVCGVIGVAPLGTEVSLDMRQILDGRTIVGIIVGDAIGDIFIPQMVELYMEGRLPFDRMLKFYPFEHINEAAQDSEKGKTVKAILKP
jgi:aryl-alcohol dehydrogenase